MQTRLVPELFSFTHTYYTHSHTCTHRCSRSLRARVFTSANSPACLPQLGEGRGEWGRWWWWGRRRQWCDLPFSWLTAFHELIYNSRQSIPLLVQSCFPMEDKLHPILDKQPTAGWSLINNGNVKERSAQQKTDQKQKKVWKK